MTTGKRNSAITAWRIRNIGARSKHDLPQHLPHGYHHLYDPSRCWNGYTIFQAKELGALLIDMNGREVKLVEGPARPAQ